VQILLHLSIAVILMPIYLIAQTKSSGVQIGYMRVSTDEQNLDLQRDALTTAGCARIYQDVCSGAVKERVGWRQTMDIAREGDVIVVWKLDRIGRNLKHIVELVESLNQQGIGLRILTGGIDTTSTAGRMILNIFAALAEFERDLIRERTAAGLRAARARGRMGGRPRMMTKAKLKTAMAMMADRSNAAGDVAATLSVSLSTLYAYIDGAGHPKSRAARLLES
jgi:DNA invertase Pin-like site-specific DNA recombinase